MIPQKYSRRLQIFFNRKKYLQLRELALKEVAGQVERKVDYQITENKHPFAMNIFLPAYLPIMKLRNALFAKRRGLLLIITVNGMCYMFKQQKNLQIKFNLQHNGI